MGEYEPNDSRNVTGTASTPDGRWTGQAANDPTMTDAQRQAQQGGEAARQQGSQQGFAEPFTAQDAASGAGGQQQQAGEAIGQSGDGVNGAGNQGNDHTSAIGQNQSAGAAGSGQASYGNSGQGMSQPQQFDGSASQPGSGGSGAGGAFVQQVAKHQEVIDADGNHVGTVDHVDGDRIKLTRQDSADGEHHYVSLSEVAGIEQGRVRLSGSGSQGSGGAQ
jgi:hypothetical protein